MNSIDFIRPNIGQFFTNQQGQKAEVRAIGPSHVVINRHTRGGNRADVSTREDFYFEFLAHAAR